MYESASSLGITPGNCTAALQAALNAGKFIHFYEYPGATFIVSSEIVAAGHVRMAAAKGTKIIAGGAINSVMRFDSITGGEIDGITFDGDDVATHTLKINNSDDLLFKRCEATDGQQYNIYPTGTVDNLTFDDFVCSSGGSGGLFADNLTLRKFRARKFKAIDNNGNGAVIKQNGSNEVFDIVFEDYEAKNNVGKGIETLGTPDRVVVNGFVAKGNGSTPLSLSAGKLSTVSKYDIDAPTHTAIELASTYGITIEPGGFVRDCRVAVLVAGSAPGKFHKILGMHVEKFTNRGIDNRAEGTLILGNTLKAELGHIADPIGIYNAAKKLRAAFNITQDCDYDIFLDGGSNGDEWSVTNNTGMNTQNTGIRVVGSGRVNKCMSFGNSFPDASKGMDTAGTITWGDGNRIRVEADVVKSTPNPSYSFKNGKIIDCTNMTGNNPYV